MTDDDKKWPTPDDKCPVCNGELERDEADVGVGVIYGPAGCPFCFWIEGVGPHKE
jgi:hypothetical protein